MITEKLKAAARLADTLTRVRRLPEPRALEKS